MANINVRIDDKMELALKKEANALGVSLSDLVREKLTGETKAKPLNQVTIESRIEQLENSKEVCRSISIFSHVFFIILLYLRQMMKPPQTHGKRLKKN